MTLDPAKLAEWQADRDCLFAARQELLSLGIVLQRYQPGGSPPPGNLVTLASWILSTLAKERDEARAALAAARAASWLDGRDLAKQENVGTLFEQEAKLRAQDDALFNGGVDEALSVVATHAMFSNLKMVHDACAVITERIQALRRPLGNT